MGVLSVCEKARSRGYEGCRVTSVGRGQGHSQLHTHRRALLSQGWDASGEKKTKQNTTTTTGKDRKGCTETRREQKGWDTAEGTPELEEALQASKLTCPILQPVEDLTLEPTDIS